MNPPIRRFGPLRATAGLAHGLLLVPGWLGVAKGSPAASVYERRFMQRIARRLVTRIDCTGAEVGGAGTLYISNHISWMDIPVLGSALDSDFIAKSDVRSWPVIGPLSRRSGTLFVAREERHRVHHQADSIGEKLRSGRSLFEAAVHAARIQPLAIGYHRGDDGRLSDDEMRVIGWTGDEALLPNLAQVSRLWLSAEVRLTPAFTPEPGLSRKALAERCQAAVAEAYAAIRTAAKRSE